MVRQVECSCYRVFPWHDSKIHDRFPDDSENFNFLIMTPSGAGLSDQLKVNL